VNREMRRLQEKEEERAKRRRAEGARRERRQRVGVRQYLHEVRQELRKVAWPTREQTVTFSVVVLVSSAFVTALTFIMDFAFKEGVLWFLG
jgi:preprotein translocase subunit SecE